MQSRSVEFIPSPPTNRVPQHGVDYGSDEDDEKSINNQYVASVAQQAEGADKRIDAAAANSDGQKEEKRQGDVRPVSPLVDQDAINDESDAPINDQRVANSSAIEDQEMKEEKKEVGSDE